MNFDQLVDQVCGKIGKTDDNAKAVCRASIIARHREIYDSFDWTAAQDTISLPVDAGASIVDVADAEKVISVRFGPTAENSEFLDPVSASYIFETNPAMLTDTGKPVYFWQKFDQASHTVQVNLLPGPDAEGVLSVLIKKKFDDLATESLIPNIEPVLTAYALADMWEFLRQLGKYQAKLQEAQTLLQAAQQRDTPASPKPRTSKILTAQGNTLAELTDSVCDILGRWEPDIRESVKERIRRNYQTLWDMYMFPESLVIANCPIAPDQQQVVLPAMFDRVLEVRTNKGGPITQVTPLKQAEISLYFDVAYNIFETSGEPLFFSMLPTIGVSVAPPFRERVKIFSNSGDSGGVLRRHPQPSRDTNKPVFIKGLSAGVETYETLLLPLGGPIAGPLHEDDPNQYTFSVNDYDEILTVSKGETDGSVSVIGATSQRELLVLAPQERERKFLRIWLLPNLGANGAVDNAGTVLVLGKRRMSPLVNDLDTPQLRNCQNILINAAAGDMLTKLGSADLGSQHKQEAAAQTLVLVKAEKEQNAFQPKITPYTEVYRPRRFSIP